MEEDSILFVEVVTSFGPRGISGVLLVCAYAYAQRSLPGWTSQGHDLTGSRFLGLGKNFEPCYIEKLYFDSAYVETQIEKMKRK